MSFPIRSQSEINHIINAGQLTIADLGIDLVNMEYEGVEPEDRTFLDKKYRLILLVAYFQNILNESGTLTNYYLDAANEKALNKMLDGIVKLSGIYESPAIALLGSINIPLIFTGQTGNATQIPSSNYLTEFANSDVSGAENADSFTSTNGNFAVWIYSVKGSNGGEGSRSGLVIAIWQGSSLQWCEPFRTPDVVGITTPIVFSVAMNSGTINLIATASTNNWSVRGLRLNLNS